MSQELLLSSQLPLCSHKELQQNMLDILHVLQNTKIISPRPLETEPIHLYLLLTSTDNYHSYQQDYSEHNYRYYHYYNFVFVDFDDFQNAPESMFYPLESLKRNKEQQVNCDRTVLQSQERKRIEQIYLAKAMFWSKTLILFSDRIHRLLMNNVEHQRCFMQYLKF